MKQLFLAGLLLMGLFNGFGQRKGKINFEKGQTAIDYTCYENGKIDPEANLIKLSIMGRSSTIKELFDEKKMIPQVPKEASYVLPDSAAIYQTAILKSGDRIMSRTSFDRLPKLEKTDRKDTVSGYICSIYSTSIRSNRIDISVYEAKNIKATPLPSLGIPEGVALRIVINGHTEIRATKFENDDLSSDKSLLSTFKAVSGAEYRNAITAGYVTSIPVFHDQQICFGCLDSAIQTDHTTYFHRVANGTVVLKKVAIPKLTNGLLFAELTEFSNGDAYDRTGSIFVIPTVLPKTFLQGCLENIDKLPSFVGRNGKTYHGMVACENYEPIVELIRFYTPFGVRHFNSQIAIDGLVWNDSAYYKQDITPLMPLVQGEVWIGAFIGNYDRGGHKINLSLKYYPGSKEVEETSSTSGKTWIKPLFCTNNVLEMAGQHYGTLFDQDSLTVTFTIPERVENLTLRYIATGHGGWGGGDEFNPKENEVFVDGKKIYGFIPWRCDCGTYRLTNPASGNFWNGISSSDYSRSGWCPGTATNPIDIPIPSLSAGTHTMKIAIPQGAPEGTSFSAWNVSGILIGEQK